MARLKKRHWLLAGVLSLCGVLGLVLFPYLHRVAQIALWPERDFAAELRILIGDPPSAEGDLSWDGVQWALADASSRTAVERFEFPVKLEVAEEQGFGCEAWEEPCFRFVPDLLFNETKRQSDYESDEVEQEKGDLESTRRLLELYPEQEDLQSLVHGFLSSRAIVPGLDDLDELGLELGRRNALIVHLIAHERGQWLYAIHEGQWEEVVRSISRELGLIEAFGDVPQFTNSLAVIVYEGKLLRVLIDHLGGADAPDSVRTELIDLFSDRGRRDRFDAMMDRTLAFQEVYDAFALSKALRRDSAITEALSSSGRQALPNQQLGLVQPYYALLRVELEQASPDFGSAYPEVLGGKEDDRWRAADEILPNYASFWKGYERTESAREELLLVLERQVE